MMTVKITRRLKAILTYPNTRPDLAIPSPVSRPLLLRIFARDTCPRITAGIPAKMKKIKIDRMPSTMLATALPSVAGCLA
jgi:hypothetical protein